jgi:hypothetical protein
MSTISRQGVFRVSVTRHLDSGDREVAESSMCPTDPWHRMQETSLDPACAGVPMACTVAAWQLRHAASVIRRLAGVARIGSGKVCVVK